MMGSYRQISFAVLAWAMQTVATVTAIEANIATQAELEMVQGIGPQLSERILAARRERSFHDWADFTTRLKGVGPVRAGKLSTAGLTVAGQAWKPPGGALAASSASAVTP